MQGRGELPADLETGLRKTINDEFTKLKANIAKAGKIADPKSAVTAFNALLTKNNMAPLTISASTVTAPSSCKFVWPAQSGGHK